MEADVGEEQEQGFYIVMMRVLDGPGESALAVRKHSMYDINLDSYCTRHIDPMFLFGGRREL